MDKKLLLVLVDALAKRAAQEVDVFAPRGPRGIRGKDGNDFVLEEHKESLLSFLLENSPKFELTEEMREELKGADGRPGRDGRDGKDFDFSEVRSDVEKIIFGHVESIREKLKLSFSELTDEERESLRGPRGDSGRDFSFEEHAEAISSSIYAHLLTIKDDLKLKFSDLTEDEKFSLRGPRGQRGKQGVGFEFEEHRGAIAEILSSYVDSISEGLKLKFSDLSAEDKDSLILKFEHLTDEQRMSLRGPRGQRGKQGIQGEAGKAGATWHTGAGAPTENAVNGDFYYDSSSQDIYHFTNWSWVKLGNIRGARGAIGPQGVAGRDGARGFDGRDGRDGRDAPVVVDIETVQREEQVTLVFTFSDGSKIATSFDLPAPEIIKQTFIAGLAAGGGGGGTGEDGASAYEIAVANGFVGTEQDWLDSLVGADGQSAYEIAVANGFVGTEQDWLDSLAAPPTTYESNGVEVGAFDRVNFVGGTVTESPAGTLRVQFPPPGGGSLEVQDESTLVTTAAQSINFIGPNVRVLPRTFMSEWPTLDDVEPSLSEYPGPLGNPDKVDVFIDFADPSIINDVACDPSVYVGAFVRMTSGGVAVNALANTYANANVIGLVEQKISPERCVIRVSGRSANVFVGLDVTADYFLSDSVAGAFQTVSPTTSGHIRLRLGQAFSASSFLMSKGERVERL